MKNITGSIVLYQTPWEDLSVVIDTFLAATEEANIFIWDNSPTARLGDKLQQKYGHLVSYNHSPENIGYGSGHNKNFDLSHSEYFCILNPDIRIQKDTMNVLVDFLVRYPKYGLVTCLIKNTDGTLQNVHKPMFSFKTYIGRALKKFLKAPPSEKDNESFLVKNSDITFLPMLSGCFLLFTSEHFKELKGFDERFFLYFEDYDLSLRSFMQDKSAVLHSTHVIHRWQRASHRSQKLFWIHMMSGIKFFSKWGFSGRLCRTINAKAELMNRREVAP